jgi:multidrug efflux pump subunit AcrB
MAALTTVVAFAPMLFIPGTEGEIWASIGIVVVGTLLLSLGEALFLLPAHLAEHSQGESPRLPRFRAMQRAANRGLQWLTNDVYIPALWRALRRPEIVLACFLALPILTFGVMQSGLIRMVFFAPVEMDSVRVEMELTPGTPVERTDEILRRIEAAAAQMRRELGEDSFGHMVTVLGSTMQRTTNGDHTGFIYLELSPSESRAVSAEETTRRWRELVGPIPEATALEFAHAFGDDTEKVDLLLTHRDSDQLRAATAALKEHLAGIEGVHDVNSPNRSGEPELRIELLSRAEALGLSRADLARQVRQGFYGAEAQRVQRGRDDLRVMVRYPEERRKSLADLENMRVRTATGAAIPFGQVARVVAVESPPTIRRTNRQRTFNVEAAIDPQVVPLGDVLEHLYEEFLPALKDRFPGLVVYEDGALQRRTETIAFTRQAFFLSVLGIYILLAMTLRSYSQPLIILLAIPFGIVGSIIGHGFRGIDVTMLSMFGIVAAAGVVVNDALVLLDAVNRFRAEGLPLHEALVAAGRLRLRPIILTSVTTFIGLLPITLQTSSQGKFLVPMAVSLASGVMFATVITLFLIPAVYALAAEISDRFRPQPSVSVAPTSPSKVADLPVNWRGERAAGSGS